MLEKTNLKSVGRHLQTKAGSQHRCLCGPPVHRFSGTLQVPAKAWHGQAEREAPRAAVHTTYDLPPGQGPEDTHWGWGEGARATAPQQPLPCPHGIKAFIFGGTAQSRVQGRGANPRGWGRGTATTKQASPWPHPPHLPQKQSPQSPQSALGPGVQRRGLAVRWGGVDGH